MNVLNKIITMFTSSADEDVSAEENFQTSFTNVVNFMLLIYSTCGGLYALMLENSAIAISDMIFSILFILYFLSNYFSIKNSPLRIGINRIVIFARFVVTFINASILGFANISIQIYPFIAIILHGRKIGTILSTLHIILIATYSTVCLKGILDVAFYYTWIEVLIIITVQTLSMFIYLVAVRWLSALIYDRIAEVGQLNGSLIIKSDMIKRITGDVSSQLIVLKKSADKLVQNRLNRPQMEQATNIRAAAANLLNTIDSISSASELDIRPIDKEDIDFNIQNVITNVLLIFESNESQDSNMHTINISPEVPSIIRGNSQLLRQVIMATFEAIDRTLKMCETPIVVKISIHDITADNLIIGFIIASENKIHLDHRDLSTSETKLLYQLRLESTQRMVKVSGGEFRASTTDQETLEIEFTLPYKKVQVHNDTDLNNAAEYIQNKIKQADIRILVADSDTSYCERIQKIMAGKIKNVVCAPHSKVALKLYENSKFDVALINMSDPNVEGHIFLRSVRNIEVGLGVAIPIYVIIDNKQQDVYLGDLEGKIDGYIARTDSAEEILEKIKETIDIEN